MVPALLSVSVSSVATTSVAEPLFFWAASAPEVRGPGTDSGSDQIGSAPVKSCLAQEQGFSFMLAYKVERLRLSAPTNKKIGSGSATLATTVPVVGYRRMSEILR